MSININNIDIIIYNINSMTIDQRLVLLIYNYKKWLDDEEVFDYKEKTFSPVIVLCMFKKYLNKNSHKLLLSESLLNYFNNYIDKQSRYFYLETKYKKKWLYKYINKKDPTNIYDLELNTINPLKYYINYIDYKERKRYFFTINDFKKIVRSSLERCYSHDLIPEPISIKNPYTNKEFTSIELENINKKLYDMPPVWHMFVDSKFNILTLKKKYNYHLIPICIPNYVEQLNNHDIIEYLQDLFETYDLNYCEECLLIDHKDIGTEKIKNILIEWIRCKTFHKIVSREFIVELKYIYGLLYCHHNNYENINIENKEEKDEKEEKKEKIVLDLDFTKPFFCTGYKDKNDRKIYIKKIKEMIKKRIQKEIKNKLTLKDINI